MQRLQTFILHVHLSFHRAIGTALCYQTVVQVCRSHAHLSPNAMQPNPEVLCVPGTEDKKKVGKDQQV